MTVNEFFTNLASGATWAAGVAFQRSNPLPLDKYSVFQSEADLITYVTTNAVAYPGQIVAVYDAEAEAMAAYVISSVGENGTYIPVGTETVIDGASIKENADGALEIAGFKDADGLTLPQKQADGSIQWVAIDAIVKGDGNTKYSISLEENTLHLKSDDGSDDSSVDLSKYVDTTYTLSGSGVDVTLTPSVGDAQTVSIDAYTKSEINAKFEALPEDKDTTYSVAENEKVLKLDGTVFSTVLALDYSDTKIKLLGKDNEVVSEIDASAFVADGVLNNVEYDKDNDKLIFTWNIAEGTNEDGSIKYKTIEVDVKDLVDTYTAGNGLELTENAFAIKLAEGSESFLAVDANGLKLSGVQDAIDVAKNAAIEEASNDATSKANAAQAAAEATASADATAKANQALADAKADAASNYATKEYVGVIPEGYTESNVIAYVNKKAQEVLDSATGGSSESAASVKQQLDTYKTENDPKVKALLTEVWGSETYTGDSRIDVLEAVGAQANVIESVVAKEGSKLTATLSGKEVTLDDSALQTLISTAQTKANEAASAASTAQATADANTQNIQTNVNDITNLKTLTQEHTGKISALETANSTHAAEFQTLNNTVTQHGTDIAGLKTGKADTTVTDALAGRITANENALKTLNETTIPGINATLDNKANSADVYTKNEVNAIIGEKAEDKTIVEMIAEAKDEATYDDTAVKALITAEETRAKGVEEDLSGRLETVEAFWEEAIRDGEEQNVIDTLKEIQDYIASDESGASAMAASIKANEDAIKAINHETTGILATANKYTDDSIAAIFVDNKASNEVFGVVKGSANGVSIEAGEIKSVSTDLLAQGATELVLSAGNASGYTVQA